LFVLKDLGEGTDSPCTAININVKGWRWIFCIQIELSFECELTDLNVFPLPFVEDPEMHAGMY
jgi:hypothetical protein